MALEVTIRISANTLEHLGQQMEALGRQMARGPSIPETTTFTWTGAGEVRDVASDAGGPDEPNDAELAKAAQETVQEKAVAFGKRKGGRALKLIVKKFGVSRVGEIPPEKYAEFLDALERATKAYKDVDQQPNQGAAEGEEESA